MPIPQAAYEKAFGRKFSKEEAEKLAAASAGPPKVSQAGAWQPATGPQDREFGARKESAIPESTGWDAAVKSATSKSPEARMEAAQLRWHIENTMDMPDAFSPQRDITWEQANDPHAVPHYTADGKPINWPKLPKAKPHDYSPRSGEYSVPEHNKGKWVGQGDKVFVDPYKTPTVYDEDGGAVDLRGGELVPGDNLPEYEHWLKMRAAMRDKQTEFDSAQEKRLNAEKASPGQSYMQDTLIPNAGPEWREFGDADRDSYSFAETANQGKTNTFPMALAKRKKYRGI